MQYNGKNFVLYNGDCVEVTKQLPTDSIHLTISSFPFANLYTYSDDERDFSNVHDLEQYFRQLDYLIPELYRVTAPGRLICLHLKQIPTFKGRDGVMGLIDFRGDMIRAFQKHGWTYHAEITIWTDPQIEATRTKSASILWNSFRKRAEITRTGMPDYIVVMQKAEREEEWIHVTHDATDKNFKNWTKLASPCWGVNKEDKHETAENSLTPMIRRMNVLNRNIVKEEKDEKHMTPLQLDTIENLIEWYSNKDEVVADFFNGIGSVSYQAVKMGRKAMGIELKPCFFEQSIKEMQKLDEESKQISILEGVL